MPQNDNKSDVIPAKKKLDLGLNKCERNKHYAGNNSRDAKAAGNRI